MDFVREQDKPKFTLREILAVGAARVKRSPTLPALSLSKSQTARPCRVHALLGRWRQIGLGLDASKEIGQ